jgi:hypothetical protein
MSICYEFKNTSNLILDVLETDLTHCVFFHSFHINNVFLPQNFSSKNFSLNYLKEGLNIAELCFLKNKDAIDEFI